MHPEINPQTIDDMGKHSNVLWGIAGSLLTGCGIFLKKIGSAFYNKWVCLVAKVDVLQKAIEDLKKEHDSDIELKDLEIEHLKEMIIEFKGELKATNKRIDDVLRG